jgi:hypothetical protein
MPIKIIHGNALDTVAGSIIHTIDGARKGMEGNVARAFARRWPDAWMEIEGQVRYPLPLGRTVATFPEEECAFPLVLISSTLHHLDVLNENQKIGVIRSALTEAIGLAIRHQARSIATTVMSGGWRLGQEVAMACMFDVLRPVSSSEHPLTVLIHMLSAESVSAAHNLAVSKNMNLEVATKAG